MVGGLVALDDVDVTDIFWTADDVEVDDDDANQLNKLLSFLLTPVAACWCPEADDTTDGDS